MNDQFAESTFTVPAECVRMTRRRSFRHAWNALHGRFHVAVFACPCGERLIMAAGEDQANFGWSDDLRCPDHARGDVVSASPVDDTAHLPPLGQPCWVTMGEGYGWILAERVEIAGATYWQELRSLGNRTLVVGAWHPIGERPARQSRPDVPVVDLTDHVDGGRLNPFFLDRAEHDAHTGDTPEPQE